MVNLASYLDRTVMEYPENIAIEESGRQILYKDFRKMAENLANYLTDNGVGRNDRIGILLPMSVDYLVSFYADTSSLP